MTGQTSNKVVVTGLGAVGCFGAGVDVLWQGLAQNKSGVQLLPWACDLGLPVTIGADIPSDLDYSTCLSTPEIRRFPPYIKAGLMAANEAYEQSGLADYNALNLSRCGVIIGSGLGGCDLLSDALATAKDKYTAQNADAEDPTAGFSYKISPFAVLGAAMNILAGQTAIRYGFTGLNFAVSSACASGMHSLGVAKMFIESGQVDVVIAGASEATLTKEIIAGFSSMNALTTNDNPHHASRPFDRERDGFVIGSGAGILVLESLEHARKRGAAILGEVSGFGQSADAYHLVQPAGTGMVTAMRGALESAKLHPKEIDYVNAHATSTPVGDSKEIAGIEEIFSESIKSGNGPCVNAPKSALGHLLGAAGAIESVMCVKSIIEQEVHPVLNFNEHESEISIDLVTDSIRPVQVKHSLCNSFGFGGTNSSAIFSQHNPS